MNLERNNFMELLVIAGRVGNGLSPELQPGVDVMKLFSSSLTLRTNELECFPWQAF